LRVPIDLRWGAQTQPTMRLFYRNNVPRNEVGAAGPNEFHIEEFLTRVPIRRFVHNQRTWNHLLVAVKPLRIFWEVWKAAALRKFNRPVLRLPDKAKVAFTASRAIGVQPIKEAGLRLLTGNDRPANGLRRPGLSVATEC
jgi:hypothetical protein